VQWRIVQYLLKYHGLNGSDPGTPDACDQCHARVLNQQYDNCSANHIFSVNIWLVFDID
jgi:hypothetical protein